MAVAACLLKSSAHPDNPDLPTASARRPGIQPRPASDQGAYGRLRMACAVLRLQSAAKELISHPSFPMGSALSTRVGLTGRSSPPSAARFICLDPEHRLRRGCPSRQLLPANASGFPHPVMAIHSSLTCSCSTAELEYGVCKPRVPHVFLEAPWDPDPDICLA